MNKVQEQVKDFMVLAGQNCPIKPIVPDEKTRILRVRLLLEEVLELAEASGVIISIPYTNAIVKDESLLEYDKEDSDNVAFEQWTVTLGDLEGVKFEAVPVEDYLGIPDALADINYVSYGAAVAYGLDLEPFEQEVHESNMTKFIDGHKDPETGKWIKGPSYRPVNFKPILDKQLC